MFQSFNLLPALTAEQNILLTLRFDHRRPDPRWLSQVLDCVGLRGRLSHRPAELSGGEQQRVAIARALVTQPRVILADEPTGNLDRRSGHEVLQMLRLAVDELRQTVVMVTHDPLAATYADSVVFLVDGRLADILPAPTMEQVTARMVALEPKDER